MTVRSFLLTVCAITILRDAETLPDKKMPELSSNMSNCQYEASTQINLQNAQATTPGSAKMEIDDLIKKAIERGIFKSKDEWTNQHETQSSSHSQDNSNNSKTVRRTSCDNAEDLTVSDQPDFTSDSIKFPGNTNSRQAEFVPSANVCKGETICSNVPNYPEQLIKNAVKKYKGVLFSSNDELPESKDIGQRIGSSYDRGEETIEFCSRQVDRIQPRSGVTINGDSRFIVNVENVTHYVAIEKCINEHSQCNFTTGLLVLGYYPGCVQKYVYRDLYALQPDGTSIRVETFRIPASCCCELRFDGTVNRMRTSSAAT